MPHFQKNVDFNETQPIEPVQKAEKEPSGDSLADIMAD